MRSYQKQWMLGLASIVKLSQSLNLSLSLRDRADTIITLYHTTPPILHHKLFKCLLGDLYSSVIHHWNHQLKPYSFPPRKNRVYKGHLWPPLSVLGLINILCDLYSSVICHWNCQLKPYSFPLWKNRVNYGHLLPSLSALGLINI